MKQLFIFLFAFLTTCSSLFAQAGTIDSSFGINGTVLRNDLVGGYNDVYGRFNGKILATRLLDTTAYITQYSNSGNPEKTIKLSSVDIQVPGSSRREKGIFTMIRANADGKIFGLGDMYEEDFSETIAFIARFNKDGSLDSSFATNGVAQYSAGNFGYALQFIIQPDNKLLLSVFQIYDAVPEIDIPVLIRYLPDGTRDSSFGTNGVAGNVMRHSSMQLQHNGKIVLGYGYKNIQLSRRNVDGSPDSSFGENGTALTNVPYLTSPYANFRLGQLTIQPNDKILATGNGDNYATCTRFDADGMLDSSFGENGFVRTPLYASSAYINLLPAVVQPDGKIIFGGKTGVYYPPTPDTSFLVRLNRNGTLDKTFNNSGYVKYASATSIDINDIALQPDGKILTCGSLTELKPDGTFLASHPYITRYNNDLYNNKVVKVNAGNTKITNDKIINIYPNPVYNAVHIYTKKRTDILLTNSSGKTVLRRNITGNATINVSQLPSGIYFVSTPELMVQKIVITH